MKNFKNINCVTLSSILKFEFRLPPRLPLKLISLFAAFTVSGCSWLFGDEGVFPGNDNNYLDAKESAEIVWPEGITAENIRTDYPIPELALSQILPTKFEVPRVEPLDAVENKGSVRVQRFEQQQWILINASPGEVWPLVSNFLLTNNIPLATADGTLGVIETDWLSSSLMDTSVLADIDLANLAIAEADDSRPNTSSVKEQFRFKLKAGVQENTTEILVTQRSIASDQAVENAPSWSQTSSLKMREDNMVKLLSEHLANTPNQASHSLLAQGIGSASRISLNYDAENRPYLALYLPFDRAWASLGLALRKASFEVSDLNRSAGVYYAHSIPKAKKEKERGFFKRLFGIGKPQEALPKNEIDPLILQAQHDGSALIIYVQRDAKPLLRTNEQAFLLRRIQGKLS
ncbi:outer membrane protein assembly factor BamC [Pseudomonadales bacterium]|nr:outer membrane protein assembly factor BamC [Pseudomonadales bacterium]